MAAQLTEIEAADRVLVWTAGGETIHTSYGTNCVAVIGSEGVLVVDPLIAPVFAREVAAAVRRRTRAPVRAVALTHHHTDHTWGATVFAAEGAPVIAHSICRERMAAEHPALLESRRSQSELRDLFADASPVLPDMTYDQGLTLHLGDVDVELWHPGWGHTPGDTFLFLPDQRVAICGDLVFAGYHFNYEHASIPGVRQGLRALGALDADTFIPGHGPAGGSGLLARQTEYHDTVEHIVAAGVEAGKDDAAIVEEIRAAFSGHREFSEYRLGVVVPSAVSRVREHLAAARKQMRQ